MGIGDCREDGCYNEVNGDISEDRDQFAEYA